MTSNSSDIKKESQAYDSGVLGPVVAQEGNEWEPGHSCTEEMCKRDAEERVGIPQEEEGSTFLFDSPASEDCKEFGVVWAQVRNGEIRHLLAKAQERVQSRVQTTLTNTHEEQKAFILLMPMSRTKCEWLFWLRSCDFCLGVIRKWGTVSLTNGRVSMGGWQISWAFAYLGRAGDALLLNYAAE